MNRDSAAFAIIDADALRAERDEAKAAARRWKVKFAAEEAEAGYWLERTEDAEAALARVVELLDVGRFSAAQNVAAEALREPRVKS